MKPFPVSGDPNVWDPTFAIKISLLNRFLLFGAVAGTVILFIAVFSIGNYFLSPKFYVDIISISSMYVMYFLRNKTSLRLKVLVIIVFLYAIFVSSLFQYGILSTHKYLVPLIPFLLILIFDLKKTIFVFGISMASYAMAAYFYISGYWVYPTPNSVNQWGGLWLISGLIITLAGAIVIMVINSYDREITAMVTNLKTTTDELQKKDEQNKHLLEEKNVMIQEIHHRVKNNLAVVSGLLELQMLVMNDENVKSVIRKSINRIMTIAKIHKMLYMSEDFSRIPFESYVNELADRILSSMDSDEKDIQFDSHIQVENLGIKQGVPLGIVFNELITNSIKYGFNGQANKRIHISILQDENMVFVVYEDNGVGIENFAESSKKSLGFSLMNSLLSQIGATYEYDTKNKFKLSFSFLLKR